MRKTQAAESLWVKATYFLTREWQYSFSVSLQSDVYLFSPHKAMVCFHFEDIFNYPMRAKEKHNGILTRLLFSLYTAFQKHLHSHCRRAQRCSNMH